MRYLILSLMVLLLFAFAVPGLPVSAADDDDSGFAQKFQRGYNIYNPANLYRPDNPLNPANKFAPDCFVNPANKFHPDNPANPANRYRPNNPLNPANKFADQNAPFKPVR